jgi:hypothetical protein
MHNINDIANKNIIIYKCRIRQNEKEVRLALLQK